MDNPQHTFHSVTKWSGGFNGEGTLKAPGLETRYSLPPSFHGKGIGTNPEELLLAAASGCLAVTLGIILDKQSIATAEISIESEMKLDGLRVDSISHSLSIALKTPTTQAIREKIEVAITRAEAMCLVANSMKGNVKTHIETIHLEHRL